MTVHEIAKLSSRGDDKTRWTLDDPAAVAAAEQTFELLQRTGFTMFRVEGPARASTRMDRFDASAEQVVAVPMIVGG